MRVGLNPNKNVKVNQGDYSHQIVIPVYIPNRDGYFKNAFQILKYCLESLFKTCHNKTFITVINNGSCEEIKTYLQDLHISLKIHEVIHTTNIGKVNAVLKGIIGHDFELITISDADVLFLSDWQNKTIDVFNAFPKTGVVCPTPSPKSYSNLTANIINSLFFSKTLAFTPILNPNALKMFAHSIGNQNGYNQYHLKQYLTVTTGQVKAVVGAGHFCATYRKVVFKALHSKYSQHKMGGESVSEFIDEPVINAGLWRLSTADNYTYHMGNIEEDWMIKTLESLQPNDIANELQIFKAPLINSFYFVKIRVMDKLLRIKNFRHFFLKKKGLDRSALESY